jgi:hypothetical protein
MVRLKGASALIAKEEHLSRTSMEKKRKRTGRDRIQPSLKPGCGIIEEQANLKRIVGMDATSNPLFQFTQKIKVAKVSA